MLEKKRKLKKEDSDGWGKKGLQNTEPSFIVDT